MTQTPVTRQKDVVERLGKELGVRTKLAVPRIQKVVVNAGIGRVLGASSKPDELVAELSGGFARLTGQHPVVTRAKTSIASFKTRAGQPVGLKTTLRGRRAEDFINRLVHIALPRSRDFKGVSTGAVDEHGNLTLGIAEHIIFPEVHDAPRALGMEVTIVTSTDDRKSSLALLRAFGVPFKKEETPV